MDGSLRTALEETIGSDPRLSSARHSALVSLCRVFADQIDDAGNSVSSRLTAAYLSALKDLDRALGRKPATPTKKPVSGANGDDKSGSALGKLRSVKGGKAS